MTINAYQDAVQIALKRDLLASGKLVIGIPLGIPMISLHFQN